MRRILDPSVSSSPTMRDTDAEPHRYSRDEWSGAAARRQSEVYHDPEWRRMRSLVRNRERQVCEGCGWLGNEVHHLMPTWESDFDPNMCVLLCRACHRRWHWHERRGWPQMHLEDSAYLNLVDL